MNRKLHRRLSASLLLFILSGCGTSTDRWTADRKPVVPVSGIVTLAGDPVEGAIVILHAPEADLSAQGRTDAEGRYQLTTYEDHDGAVVGSHTVTVRKTEYTKTPTKFHTEDEPSYAMLPTEILPEKYATQATSDLKATVPEEGTSELNFEF